MVQSSRLLCVLGQQNEIYKATSHIRSEELVSNERSNSERKARMSALARYELCSGFHLIGMSCKSIVTYPFAFQECIKHQSGIGKDMMWPTSLGLCTPRVPSTCSTKIWLQNVIVTAVCMSERIIRARNAMGGWGMVL